MTLVFGCSQVKIEPYNISNNSTSVGTNAKGDPIASPDVKKEIISIKVVEDFIKSIKNSDAEALKSIMSPSGLILIRNFSSGNGARGKDIRNLYLADKIPVNLQFVVSSEVPISLNQLFDKSQQTEIANIPMVKLNDNGFHFKDDLKSNMFGPPTNDVRDICGEITSTAETNNQYSPRIFELVGDEIVLTESALVADSPVGVWAVFVKVDDKYFLRAIIDLK